MISTVLELVAFVLLVLFGFLAAGWLGAVLIAMAVVLVIVSFRFEP